LVAAAELGVPLDRFALVPEPGERWPVVVASLLDGVDLVLLAPPKKIRHSDARRLLARARERGSVLMLVGAGRSGWPESPDVRLDVESASWQGLGGGHGTLRARQVEVTVAGRRVAGGKARRLKLWLPDHDGRATLAGEETVARAGAGAGLGGRREAPAGARRLISAAG
jgi:hypothetical protein